MIRLALVLALAVLTGCASSPDLSTLCRGGVECPGHDGRRCEPAMSPDQATADRRARARGDCPAEHPCTHTVLRSVTETRCETCGDQVGEVQVLRRNWGAR